jgi:SAM-dependent methyltransferase
MVERSGSDSYSRRPAAATNSAARQWRAELAAWRIDDDILARATESPYGLTPAQLAVSADDSDRLPHRLAREALPDGGTVLDVGCGTGSASSPLAPPAATLLGVDESADLLAEFESATGRRGVATRVWRGRWPDIAGDVDPADVVVCHHVFYNVPDLGEFAVALATHARRRVVVELTLVHPWVPIGELWRQFHGQPRPTGPTADLAADVLAEAGIRARLEHAPDRPRPVLAWEDDVEGTRRRLCLPPERAGEVADAMRARPPRRPAEVAVLWWDTQPGAGND